MRIPSTEQQAVVDSDARVRVVRAAPGSGKTWLVAEVIRNELHGWNSAHAGIAALSFTRVGGDEIRKAVDQELGHPHFVGTIDAFLFRYVLRPFLRRCVPTFAEPRLVPGDWGAKHWANYAPNQKATVGTKGINIFDCVCIDESGGQPVMAYKPYPAQPLKILAGNDLSLVNAAKDRIWQQTGQLTHSDAALWASRVLDHPTFGPVVRAEIVRRFPLLIIDELQDTGFFLGKSLRALLAEPSIRGVLVGDPDQAIFEFNGARPDLFAQFETVPGAVTLPLPTSRRCPAAVTTAAAHLQDTGGTILPAPGRAGRAILVRYNDMVPDVQRLAVALRETRPSDTIKIITRSNATVADLVGKAGKQRPKLGCPSLNHMFRAVVDFRQGRQTAALGAAVASLEVAILGHESVSELELANGKIDTASWKALAVRSLLESNALPTPGTIYEWATLVGQRLDASIAAFGLDPSLGFTPGKIKPRKLNGWDKAATDFLPQSGAMVTGVTDLPVRTVHGVKGETHDLTIFVCPRTAQAARCPSVVWWSTDAKDREEKRISYVAMTRTQGDLILSVSDACHQRLAANQAGFTSSFQSMTVDECEAAIRAGAGQANHPTLQAGG